MIGVLASNACHEPCCLVMHSVGSYMCWRDKMRNPFKENVMQRSFIIYPGYSHIQQLQKHAKVKLTPTLLACSCYMLCD